jgi:hypothetical protein
MTQITIEYMIMIPLLILQIFLFPIAATIMMDHWADSRRSIELQAVAGHLASTIQQVYYTVNSVGGSLRNNLDIPISIEGYRYSVTLGKVDIVDSSYKIMNITLCIASGNLYSSTLVTLGDNVEWQDNLSFDSFTHNLCLVADKSGGSITLTVGGT